MRTSWRERRPPSSRRTLRGPCRPRPGSHGRRTATTARACAMRRCRSGLRFGGSGPSTAGRCSSSRRRSRTAASTCRRSTADSMRSTQRLDASSGTDRPGAAGGRRRRSPRTSSTSRSSAAPNVIHARPGGELDAFATSDGALRWRRELGATESSPLVAGGAVLVGDWDGDVWSLAARTGRTRWRTRLDGAVKGSLAISGRPRLHRNLRRERVRARRAHRRDALAVPRARPLLLVAVVGLRSRLHRLARRRRLRARASDR